MDNSDSGQTDQSKTKKPDPFRRTVWSFAVAETLIWAALYYSFPALLPEWERAFGWTKSDLSLAFTSALIVAGILAPSVGRLIDRGHALKVYMGSTTLGIISLVLLSMVQDYWQFYAIWLSIGVAMSGSLYEPCFAIITRITGTNSKWAITRITLIAGLAGTVSFPSAHFLTELYGWRTALLIFAGVVAVVALPLIWTGCKRAVDQLKASRTTKVTDQTPARNTLVLPVFWFLVIAFTTINITHGMILTHFLPILDDRGIAPDTAVIIAALIGPMQVTGRMAMMAAERRISTYAIAIGCFVIMACSTIVLLNSNGMLIPVVIFVLFYGSAYGVTSIVRPVITADVFGRQNFGVISGMLALPFMFGAAISPTISALIWSIGGYDLVIITALISVVIGLLSLSMVRMISKKRAR
jgi:predicted MFS family arabinose efflux permease